MLSVETERARVALSSPQAVSHTSAVLWHPPVVTGAAFLLAHGAGTDLTHPFLRAVARGLAERGHPAVTFNFGFTEAGRKRPDPMPRLESAYADVVAWARDRFGPRPLVLGGRSMGGRVGSHLAAQGVPCAGLAFLGYPLHPAGRPERLRTGHWPRLRVPVLFVTGQRDKLCDLDLLARERARHLAAVDDRLHVVAGGDHSFKVRAADGRSQAAVQVEVIEAVTAWAAGTVPAGSRP